jgi:prephenate dehydrogenase
VFKRVAIVGVGLIGGSFALRIKKKFPAAKLHLVSRKPETLRLAKKLKILDSSSHQIDQSIANCDLIILSTSIEDIPVKFKQLLPHLNPQTIVIDVGSTKEKICDAIKVIDRQQNFVGCHPMAGSDKTGLSNASVNLFENSIFAITPHLKTDMKKVTRLKQWATQLRMQPLIMKPRSHDEVVAGISHLPYFAAAALVEVLGDDEKNLRLKKVMASSGFRDTTRVSASDPTWGAQVANHNDRAVVLELQRLIDSLESFKNQILKRNNALVLMRLKKIKKLRAGMF